MTTRNIPIDLLRTFVTVVDRNGFTRAAEALGRSQPAISLQIKKLQDIVGAPLLVKDTGPIRLTEQGELVASYARRMLALNDELVVRVGRKAGRGRLRIGLPNDYADQFLAESMMAFRDQNRHVTLEVQCDVSINLLRDFQSGLYDLVLAMTSGSPAEGATITWREPLAWVGNAPLEGPHGRVPLVAYPEGCIYRRTMLNTLQREGRSFELVYVSPSLAGIEAAIRASFGYTVLARRTLPKSLPAAGADRGLPVLADMVAGLYVATKDGKAEASALAFAFAEAFEKRVKAA